MLDQIAGSGASGTTPDPYAWPDNGECWVKEPRRRAPALDSFMSHVHRLGAEQIMFSTWKRASFRLWGDNHWVERPSLDEAETGLIVNHLYGADGMARIQGGKDLNVMYVIGVSRTQTLRFRVNVSGIVTSKGDGANVTIRPVKDLPPPLEQQNVEPEILKAYRMKKGLMIVSGATGSGKSTLIGGMTMAKLLDPSAHLNIIECAEPIEFLLDRVKSPSSTINQSEIPRNIESFETYMEGAMRRQPTDIIIGECRKPEHMEATIRAAISGHATCTTLHAENVALTMQRVAGLFPPEQMKNLMISASQALRLIINQRLVKDPRNKWTPLREFLVFDAVENGRLGKVSQNANKTVDIGPMQVNDTWIKKIAAHWRSSEDAAYLALRDNFCANVEGGAWILRQGLDEAHGDLWEGVALYHSHTEKHKVNYLQQVLAHALLLRRQAAAEMAQTAKGGGR